MKVNEEKEAKKSNALSKTSTLDFLTSVMQEDGMFFQQRCKKEVEETAWTIEAEEHAIPHPIEGIKGSSTDIIASRTSTISSVKSENKKIYLIIECKKANPLYKTWVFFSRKTLNNPDSPLIIGGMIYNENDRQAYKKIGIIGFDSLNSAKGSKLDYCYYGKEVRFDFNKREEIIDRENKKRRKATSSEAINNAADQLTLATSSFLKEELNYIYRGGLTTITTVFIPLLVTTADLLICDFPANQVNLEDGNISDRLVTYRNARWLIYEYPIPLGDLHDKPMLNAYFTPLQRQKGYTKKQMFVVNSKNLREFLNLVRSCFVTPDKQVLTSI